MCRPGRRLFTLCSAASLLLCAAACVLWVRSYSAARSTVGENPPIELAGLRDLFEHLDRTSSTGYECDHTFRLTRAFLAKGGFPVEPMITWLGENGAGCDCEVMMNTAAAWEEAAGYTPPDEDE